MKQLIKNNILSTISILIGGYLFFFGIFKNEDFMKFNLINLLTLLVAIYLSYFLTQKRIDNRTLKVKTEKIIDETIELINSYKKDYFVGEFTEGKIDFQLFIKKIHNKCRFLDLASDSLNFKFQMAIINQKVDEIDKFISEHLSEKELDYLKKSKKSYIRLADDIETQCNEIFMILYKS